MDKALSWYMDQFLLDRSLFLAEKTILMYKSNFKPLIVYLEDRWPPTKKSLEGFILQRKQKVSITTVNMNLRHAKTFLSWCVKRKYLKENPFNQLTYQRIRERPRIPETLSREDLQRILYYAASQKHHGRREYAIILLLADTGMRPGELCNLLVGDFNERECSLHLYGKTGERLVPVSPPTVLALKTWLKDAGTPPANAPLFCQESGKPLIREDLNCIFWRIRDKLKLRKFYPYLLRHTFATEFLRNGGNMEALRRMLGHAGLNLIQRYAHLNFSDLVQAQLQASPIAHIRVHAK